MVGAADAANTATGGPGGTGLDRRQELASVLSIQEQCTVANDYTIRLENQVYQLLPPAWPGERKGKGLTPGV